METLTHVLTKAFGYALHIEVWLVIFLLLLSNLRRKTFAAMGIVGLFGFLGFVPIGDLLLSPIENQYPQNPVIHEPFALVVFGGAEDIGATLRWGGGQLNSGAERIVTAATLAQKHPEALVILLGGSGRLRDSGGALLSEAYISASVLTSLGISRERLLLEGNSRNTRENAHNALSQIEKDQLSEPFVLITSASHMGRAVKSFANNGFKNLIPYPVDYRSRRFRDGLGWNFIANLTRINIAIKEWVGRVVY